VSKQGEYITPMLSMIRSIVGSVRKRNSEYQQRESFSAIAYPPKASLYPSVSAKDVIASNEDIIREIQRSYSGSNYELEHIIMPLIHRYIAYVHLLPASQRHHHRHKGGLAKHGLEAAKHALRMYETRLFALRVPPSSRKRAQASWRVAIVSAALLHDVGKPVSDMIVSNDEGEKWDGHIMPLSDWLKEKKTDGYAVQWRKDNRVDRHKTVGSAIAITLLDGQFKSFLAETPVDDVMSLFLAAIQGNTDKGGIHEITIASDRKSVEEDIAENGSISGEGEEEPIGYILKSAIRWLYQSKKWVPNKPGGVLWCIDGNPLLVWPEAAKQLVKQLQEERQSGIPTNPDVLADLLIESSVAIPTEESQGGDRLWLFQPANVKSKNPLIALRLANGVVCPVDDLESTEGEIIHSISESNQDTTETSAARTDKESKEDNKPKSDTATPEAELATQQSKKQSVKPETKNSASKVSATAGQEPKSILNRLGHLREVLLAMAEDMKQGNMVVGEHYAFYKGGLAIAYPDGLAGYGMESKTILGRLAKNNEIITDPISPQKKVLNIPGLGGAAGIGTGVVLSPALSKEICDYAKVSMNGASLEKSPNPEKKAIVKASQPKQKKQVKLEEVSKLNNTSISDNKQAKAKSSRRKKTTKANTTSQPEQGKGRKVEGSIAVDEQAQVDEMPSLWETVIKAVGKDKTKIKDGVLWVEEMSVKKAFKNKALPFWLSTKFEPGDGKYVKLRYTKG